MGRGSQTFTQTYLRKRAKNSKRMIILPVTITFFLWIHVRPSWREREKIISLMRMQRTPPVYSPFLPYWMEVQALFFYMYCAWQVSAFLVGLLMSWSFVSCLLFYFYSESKKTENIILEIHVVLISCIYISRIKWANLSTKIL